MSTLIESATSNAGTWEVNGEPLALRRLSLARGRRGYAGVLGKAGLNKMVEGMRCFPGEGFGIDLKGDAFTNVEEAGEGGGRRRRAPGVLTRRGRAPATSFFSGEATRACQINARSA